MAPMPVASLCWKSSNRYGGCLCPPGSRDVTLGASISSSPPAMGTVVLLSPLHTYFLWPQAFILLGSCSSCADLSPRARYFPFCRNLSSCAVHRVPGLQASGGTCSAWPNSCLLFLFQLIWDYSTPPNEELSRDLVAKLKPHIR